MELAADHHYGFCSFEVAPIFCENLCTRDLLAVNDVEGICSVPVCWCWMTEIPVRA